MNAKDAILYLYDKGLLNIDAIMKNKDSIMQELDNATENKPKYDPCRLFRKGDKVRIVKHNGRKFDAAPPTFQLGKVYRVDEDEDTENCYVMLQSCDLYYAHPVAFLELVTPVEELEPYKLIDSPKTYNIVRDIAMVMTIHKKSHPNAKAAAEAERDRLNAEHRKEQK